MKKEIWIVLSVVLVVVIVACGLWLGYYAVDSCLLYTSDAADE